MTTLAEDVLLLLTDDATGRHQLDGSSLDTVLAGALLLELALAGRLDVRTRHGLLTRHRTVVLDPAPVGDPVLDDALVAAQDKDRSPQDLIRHLGTGLRRRLLERLAERGVLSLDADKVLGIFPRERWPAQDSTHEDQLRHRLHDVLVVGTTPDQRTGALVALLSAADRAHRVLADLDRDQRRRAKARGAEIAEGAWAADAVRRVIADTQAALVAVTVAAGAAASSSS